MSIENVTFPAGCDRWTEIEFDALLENVTSSTKKVQQKDYLADGKYPVVDQGETLVGGYTNDEELVHGDPLPVIVFGDHTRCIKYLDFPFVQGADGTKLLSPAGQVSAKYVYWALRSAHIPSRGYARHFSILRKARFPLAPVKEQSAIVDAIESYLSRLDAAVAGLKRVQANLKRYRSSVLKAAVEGRLVPTEAELARAEGRTYEPASELLARILKERRARWEAAEFASMKAKGKPPKNDSWKSKYQEPTPPDTKDLPALPEGWCWATVDQLAPTVQYGSSAKTSEDADGVPVLRMGNIVDGELDFDALKYLPRDHGEFPELLLEPGDMLFNRTNSPELVGKSAVYKGSAGPYSYASYLIRVRFSPGVEASIVAAYLNSPAGRGWVASVRSQQVGQANVNGTKLKQCVVPVPPMAEQTRLVTELEKQFSVISQSLLGVGRELIRTSRLRQSILKWAFEGKLVDQDPNDEPASALLERIRAEREAATSGRTHTKKKAPIKGERAPSKRQRKRAAGA